MSNTQPTPSTSYASVVNSGSSTNTLQIKVVPDNPKIESLSNSESVAKAIVIEPKIVVLCWANSTFGWAKSEEDTEIF
ncbi:hypothetical protein pipiens_004968 [Culex pipiens pipiens]|uniref:Uncharacterized protein n=1 Tax=Culex pipiens pipiens TaxID=38569 RepID=A0ABD1CCV9_CULPP